MQIPGFTANWSVYDRGDDGAANSPRRGGLAASWPRASSNPRRQAQTARVRA